MIMSTQNKIAAIIGTLFFGSSLILNVIGSNIDQTGTSYPSDGEAGVTNEEVLASVTYYGGLCAYPDDPSGGKPCEDKVSVYEDGTVIVSSMGDMVEQGTLPDTEVQRITDSINDYLYYGIYDDLREISGCAAAYDGTSMRFEYLYNGETMVFDQCEYDLRTFELPNIVNLW